MMDVFEFFLEWLEAQQIYELENIVRAFDSSDIKKAHEFTAFLLYFTQYRFTI